MQITPSNLGLLKQGFNAAFKGAFTSVSPMWDKIAMLVPSSSSEEVYAWLGANTKLREWIGERVHQNLKLHGYTIKNKTFEGTVTIPREAIEDDQYGTYTPLVSQMGQDANLHPDELLFGLIQLGISTGCYDGQYYFDTDHPVGLSGQEASVSNFTAGAGNPWYLLDTTKVLKPFIVQKRRDYAFVAKTSLTDENVFNKNEFVFGVDGRLNVGFGLWQQAYCSKATLDSAGYEAARTAMMSFKADNGKPLGITPNILLVGPSNEKKALDMVTAERLANGADNVYRNTAKVITCPWLP
ncbi:Mu-like prophage major head subunit gpT family protein [Rhodoferax sp.]|uniref:Mu-like prophage major head subunit gpT family protein n=1 Tax=Rhodoferax sp. TaxID=50421 RepID=UPI002ACE8241|nr:Mu-like prophage major head subunit gpT family protein [Rhodoferax sp.]MDZ7920752.1 Mu-like prophage major head subunit gpT family protein [Rhodoferax sp.]